MIKSETLDRRITIERASEIRDGFNSPRQKWLPIGPPLWARKQEVKDDERLAAQEVGAEVTTRFTVRWSSLIAGVDPKDRLIFEGRVYDIAGVTEIGRRDGLEIRATARADK